MYTLLTNVLTVNEVGRVNELVASEALVDGRATSVVGGKRNLQLPVNSAAARQAGAIVTARLLANEQFNLFAQPAAAHPPLFSRYEEGMEYPDHIDVALMGRVRTDIAVTVFLSEPDTYAGGELVIDTGNGIRSYRSGAGDAIAYPASTVHHVARVTRGVRLVAALWVQSLIRDPARREILYDLASAMEACDDTACGGRLRRSYWNLLRMWAEPATGS
jgi:PKHD-type hydroxylase